MMYLWLVILLIVPADCSDAYSVEEFWKMKKCVTEYNVSNIEKCTFRNCGPQNDPKSLLLYLDKNVSCDNRFWLEITLEKMYQQHTVLCTCQNTTPSYLTIKLTKYESVECLLPVTFNMSKPDSSKVPPFFHAEVDCSASSSEETIASTSKPDTNQTLKEKLEDIKRELSVEKKTLSITQRKFISIPDSRLTAVTAGVIGITILVGVIGTLVLPDVLSLIRHIVQIKAKQKDRHRNLKKCVRKKQLTDTA